MNRFLAIGECMIEMSVAGDGLYRMGFAGDTFNTAWYLRRLLPPGVEVAYLSAVGDDAPSRRMEGFMRDAGLVPELAVREGGAVGLYMISLKDGERSFSYWRANSAARSLADDLDALPGLAAGDMAYFSGITMAILPEAGRRRLLDVLDAARGQGIRVAFDPNLRPRLWQDGDEMRRWITRAAGSCDVALPSHEDEADHFGDTSPDATGRRYRAAGAATVIVKNGADAVLALQDGTRMEVRPEKVAEVIDTTAAGDAFNAGLLAAWQADPSLEAAIRAGCNVSARVIAAPGALVEI